MLTRLLALSLFLSVPSFAADRSVDDIKTNIKRLTDHVYEEVTTSRVEAAKLQQAETLITQALGVIRGDVLPPSNAFDRNGCMKLIMDANYAPGTAASACDAISTNEELGCLKTVLGANYGPDRAVAACKGIKADQLSCFNDVMSRSYGPDRAREACVR